MLSKLREYQRKGGVPQFRAFCDEIMEACVGLGRVVALCYRSSTLYQIR
jgi:hypothetical protein